MKKYILISSISGLCILISFKIIKNKKNKKIKPDAISFSHTGGHFSYQLGIAKYLQQKFKLDNFKYAGVSGGSQCALCLALNISVDYYFQNFVLKTFDSKYNSNYHELQYISKKNIKFISKKYNLKLLDNKLYIGTTKIYPYWHSITFNKWGGDFDNLFSCICATQYIPFIFGNIFFTIHNQKYIDGAFTNLYYKPTKDKWLHIDLWNFKEGNIFDRYFLDIINLINLFDKNFHIKQYENGFNDAFKYHNYFLDNGLIEK